MSDGDSWKSGRFCGSSLLIRDSGAVNATKEEPIRGALLVLCSVRGFFHWPHALEVFCWRSVCGRPMDEGCGILFLTETLWTTGQSDWFGEWGFPRFWGIWRKGLLSFIPLVCVVFSWLRMVCGLRRRCEKCRLSGMDYDDDSRVPSIQRTLLLWRVLRRWFQSSLSTQWTGMLLELMPWWWVWWNSIIYQRAIYPPENFKRTTKYGLPMVLANDESLQNYIKQIIAQLNSMIVRWWIICRVAGDWRAPVLDSGDYWLRLQYRAGEMGVHCGNRQRSVGE